MTSHHESTESWQLITGDKEYRDVQSFIKNVKIADAGFNYHVVAVFGSQSTGKSTLLNRLFGTTFATMDTISRQQTTKGIWISKAAGANILVMDVEGTDGRERGEDQDFERKSALFSLATSEVLVVNMWETQVGLYNGANMGLLKTVFEVNLQLFPNDAKTDKKSKSLLLFVIRDHLGTTPISNLSQSINKDLSKIWSSLSKPTGQESSDISDYFDVEFVGLPHKILMEEKFNAEVATLRERFSDKSQDTLLRTTYHKNIPADGFSVYAKGIWEAIEANKDLDLPTQQELLAQFRCDEIAAVCLSSFDSVLSASESKMRLNESTPDIAPILRTAYEQTISAFDEEASRYNQTVYQRKRAEICSTIGPRLLALYRHHLANVRKTILVSFGQTLKDRLPRDDLSKFSGIIGDLEDQEIKKFASEATQSTIPVLDWSYEEDLAKLQSDLKSASDDARTSLEQEMVAKQCKVLGKKSRDIVVTEFANLDSTIYDRIHSKYVSTELEASKTKVEKALTDLQSSEVSRQAAVAQLSKQAMLDLRRAIADEVDVRHLSLRLREHFEKVFKFENDVPRIWKTGDDIETHYKQARADTLDLVPVLAQFKEEITEDEDEHVMLSPADQADLVSRLNNIFASAYLDAKRSIVSSVASIPMFFYVLLLVLGWNELMALIRNPLYFLTIAFAGLVAYAVYRLNLTTPVEQVARAMFETTLEIIKDKLRAALEISQDSTQHTGATGDIELKEISMKKEE